MTFIPRAQEIYKHFKGNLYQIVTLAEHTETGETLVIYQALYEDFKIYARPLSLFCSKVDKQKYPDVRQEYRFELQQTGKQSMEKETASTVSEMSRVLEKEAILENTSEQQNCTPEELESEEMALDPMLLAFLDAESYVEKLNILAAMHHRITDDLITTMAIANDIEIEEGDLENRYNQLKNCLQTLDRYEITRLR